MPDRWQPDDRNQLSSDANKALDQNLVLGEAVKVIIRGAQRSAMVGTDRRVFVFKKGFMSGALFGSKLASYDYRNLSGVHVEAGLLSGFVALQGPGLDSTDMSYWRSGKADPWKVPHALAITEKDQARERCGLLRALVAESHQALQPGAVASAPDVTDQLRKLGELREAGVLTEEEFAAKKAEMLSRL